MTAIGLGLVLIGWIVARVALTPSDHERVFGMSAASVWSGLAGVLLLLAGGGMVLWVALSWAWRALP